MGARRRVGEGLARVLLCRDAAHSLGYTRQPTGTVLGPHRGSACSRICMRRCERRAWRHATAGSSFCTIVVLYNTRQVYVSSLYPHYLLY